MFLKTVFDISQISRFLDCSGFFVRPVLPLLGMFMAGIVGAVWCGAVLSGLVWCAAFTGLAVVIRCLRRHESARYSPAVLCFCLGYVAMAPYIAPDFPARHIIHFRDTQKYDITGTIVQAPVYGSGRLKLVIRVNRLDEPGQKSISVTGKIRVTVKLDPEADTLRLNPGDVIRFRNKIRAIRNFSNPGGFDYERYMAFQKIYGSAYTSQKRLTILYRSRSRNMRSYIGRYRRDIAALIASAADPNTARILNALIIGDRNAVSPELREAFNRVGVGHVLAISGLHMGIVAAIAFGILTWIFTRFRWILWQAWSRKASALLALVPVVMYGTVAGMSPSTQRAVIMVVIFLLAILLEREHEPFNTLAWAAMVILIIFPPALYSVSFQLSFAAVTSIFMGLPKITLLKSLLPETFPNSARRLVSMAGISLFAVLGTLPIVLYYFNQLSLIGILANLVFIPLIGFLVVPSGLTAAFIYPFWSGAGSVLMQICAFVLKYTIGLISGVAHFPFAALKTVSPSIVEMVLYYALFIALMHLKHPKTRVRKWSRIGIVSVVMFAALDVGYWVNYRFLNDTLRVTYLDVGNGNAALLELPGGRCVMIDGGGFPDNAMFDVGARIIAPVLWKKKIATVDTLILSHANSDHLNGLIYIVRHFHVRRVVSNSEAADTKSYRDFITALSENRLEIMEFQNQPRRFSIGDVRFFLLYPLADFKEKKKHQKWRDCNENSLVVKVCFKKIAFLFPGDITVKAEQELSTVTRDALQSTVLLAPHHGSKTSSSDIFLNYVDPQYAVISAGWQNWYGFPHSEVLTRYEERSITLFQTHLSGACRFETDGHRLKISSQR